MNRNFLRTPLLAIGSCTALLALSACADDSISVTTVSTGSDSGTSGDGDGDGDTGDGDGDGDSATGDGDGDTGDGDGDSATGDGDGDTGDGDGDTGDGDGDGDMGMLRLTHLGVFPGDMGTDVDIFVNGMPSGVTFAFKEGTDYVELPPGSYTFDVVPAGGIIDDSVYTVPDFPIAAGDMWEVWAGGYVVPPTVDDASFVVSAFAEDAAAIDPGNLRLNVVHGAAMAAASPVDVWAVDDTCAPMGMEPLIPGFNFGDVVPNFDVPAGPLAIGLDIGQDATVDACFFVPDLGISGDFVNLFAVNDDAGSVSLIAHLPDGTTAEVLPAQCMIDADCDDDCNAGTCNAGVCETMAINDGGACVSGDLCGTNGACDAGACVEEQVDCSYLDGECGTGACDSQVGCYPEPQNDGMACDDGNSCTDASVCADGLCADPGGEGYLFFDDFSDDQGGWTLGMEWEIGAAAASNCAAGCPGNDPAEDHTPTDDNGIAGVLIGACAPTAQHPDYCITSPVIDTSAEMGDVWVTYWRHLHSDYSPYMINSVQAWDGNGWQVLNQTAGFPCSNDMAWTEFGHDVTAYKGPDFQVRFCYRITAGGAYTSGQWNLDDVTVGPIQCTP